jgi:hypothetical protein
VEVDVDVVSETHMHIRICWGLLNMGIGLGAALYHFCVGCR